VSQAMLMQQLLPACIFDLLTSSPSLMLTALSKTFLQAVTLKKSHFYSKYSSMVIRAPYPAAPIY
jgi:hypothetical protein